MSKEAMKLALEALETERENYQDWDKQDGAPEYIYEAITALREALAKPDFWEGYVPEPVKPAPMTKDEFMEPLGCVVVRPLVANSTTPKPAQRTWVGLSDDEIWKFWWSRPEVPEGEDDSMEAEFVAAVRQVLAAYGIKENT